MKFVARLRFSLREATRILRGTGTLSCVVALTGLFVLSLATYVVPQNAAAFSRAWPGGSAVVAYLDGEVTDAQAQEAVAELAKVPGVRTATYVDATDTLARIRSALAGNTELLEGIDPASYPASIELLLEPGLSNVVMSSPLVQRLRASAAIEDVDLSGQWQDPLASSLRAVSRGTHTALLVMMVVCGIAMLVLLRLRLAKTGTLSHAAQMFGAGPWVGAAPAALAAVALVTLAMAVATTIVYVAVTRLAATPWQLDGYSMTPQFASPIVVGVAAAAIAVGSAVFAACIGARGRAAPGSSGSYDGF